MTNDRRFEEKKKSAAVEKVKKIFFSAAALAFWIGVWWIAALIVGKEWILPAPAAVMKAFFASFANGSLPLRALRSFAGITAGWASGVFAGFLLAALTARIKALHLLFSPLLTVVRATPVASFILILWVVFARETVPAFSVMLIVAPIVWGNCETGFLSADKKLSEVCRVYDLPFLKRARFLWLPAVFPHFRSAAVTSLGMAWKAGVAAEVLCTPDGTIGQMIWASKRDIETAELFAWTLAVILACFLLENLLKLLLALPDRRGKHKDARAERGKTT